MKMLLWLGSLSIAIATTTPPSPVLLWAQEMPAAFFASAGIAGAGVAAGNAPIFSLASGDGFVEGLSTDSTNRSAAPAPVVLWNVSVGSGFRVPAAATARHIDADAVGPVDVVVTAVSNSSAGGAGGGIGTCALLGIIGQTAACDRIKWRFQVDCILAASRGGPGNEPATTISDDGSVAFLAVSDYDGSNAGSGSKIANAFSSSSSSSTDSNGRGIVYRAVLYAVDGQSGALLWTFAPPPLPPLSEPMMDGDGNPTGIASISTSRDGASTAWAVGRYIYVIEKATGKLRAPPIYRVRHGAAQLCPMGVFLVFGGGILPSNIFNASNEPNVMHVHSDAEMNRARVGGIDSTAGATILRWSSQSQTYELAPDQLPADTADWNATSFTISKNGGPPPALDGCLVAVCWTHDSGGGGGGSGTPRATVTSLLSGKVFLDWRGWLPTSPSGFEPPSIAMHMNYAAVVSGPNVLLFDVMHSSDAGSNSSSTFNNGGDALGTVLMNYTAPVPDAKMTQVDVLYLAAAKNRSSSSSVANVLGAPASVHLTGSVLVVASGTRSGSRTAAGLAYGFEV